MKSKLLYGVNFLWAGLMALTFPLCFGCIYLDLTGHSKGYGYDLGPEKDISVMLGLIELLVWLALALPSGIYVFNRTAKKGRLYVLIPALLYLALAVGYVIHMGGFAVYMKDVFNI